MNDKRYSIIRKGTIQPGVAHHLAVPNHLARLIPEGMQFTCKLTDEGILYVPAKEDDPEPDLPAWITQP